MGGRGSSSRTSKGSRNTGLPNGAVAFTAELNGENMFFYQSSTGVIFTGYDVNGKISPDNSINLSIGDLYARAKQSNSTITLHSAKEFDQGREHYRQIKKNDGDAVTWAETHPNGRKTGIPARRLVYRPRRNKG